MRATDLPAHTASNMAAKPSERSIGAILIDAGRLRHADAMRILELQEEKTLRFGDAARQLGLLSDADIEFALARQFDYPYLQRGESKVSEDIVAAYDPFSPQVESLRWIRCQLMLRWFGSNSSRRALTVVSAARNEGRSYVAANLAVMFAQLGQRTLLIDADLRNPSQHRLFGLDNREGLSAVLSGRAGPESVKRIVQLPGLSVLPAGALPPNPQELLSRPAFANFLYQLSEHLDVILLDSTMAAESAEAQIIVARSGGALIVARRNFSRVKRLRALATLLTQANATIVGAVLNDV